MRHGEPERIAPGTGVPADPALTARGREQAERLAAWLAAEPIDVVLSSPQRRARSRPRSRSRAPTGSPSRSSSGLIEYDAQSDSYIPMEELRATNDPQLAAMYEGRWEEFGAESTETFRARVAGDARRDRRRAPGPARRRGVPRRRHQRRASRSSLGLDRHLWFEPHYTSLSRMVASRTGVRSVASLNERAHLDGRRDPT